MIVGTIAPYPPKNALHSGTITFYMKALANSLKKLNADIICLADGNGDAYTEHGIKVIRCWKRGISYPFSIFTQLSKYANKINIIHVQHEYYMYGNEISAALFPFMLLLLKFLRKPIVVTLHSALPLTDINKAFTEENRVRGAPIVLRTALLLVTKLISSLSTRIIVHENVLKQRLFQQYKINPEKIEVVPLGIEDRSRFCKSEAKRQMGMLDKTILLYMGYITGYKGVETLIDAFKLLKDNEDYVLFIAGGAPSRSKSNDAHQSYLKEIKGRGAAVSKNIIFTGFLQEEKLPLFFSAADLAVFPHKVKVGFSGPMSLAVAFESPFIASESFEGIIDEELLFNGTCGLAEKINQFFEDAELRRKISIYVKELKEERSWDNVARQTRGLYEKLICTPLCQSA